MIFIKRLKDYRKLKITNKGTIARFIRLWNRLRFYILFIRIKNIFLRFKKILPKRLLLKRSLINEYIFLKGRCVLKSKKKLLKNVLKKLELLVCFSIMSI